MSHFEAKSIPSPPPPATRLLAPSDLLQVGTISCVTSVTSSETDKAGPACILGLFGGGATEALELPEHLQTESNEAACPARTNQLSLTLKEPRKKAGS